jgi:hypothetical protein
MTTAPSPTLMLAGGSEGASEARTKCAVIENFMDAKCRALTSLRTIGSSNVGKGMSGAGHEFRIDSHRYIIVGADGTGWSVGLAKVFRTRAEQAI